MPYRPDLSTPPEYNHLYDRFGGFHEDRAQMRETNPRGGGDEVCPVCLRAVAAQEACPACGDDEDMEAA